MDINGGRVTDDACGFYSRIHWKREGDSAWLDSARRGKPAVALL